MKQLPVSIEVKCLTKRFGPVNAIEDVSFAVTHGEVVGFLGPNGAGKSTTMRILCGLISATSGFARIAGISVARHPNEIKRRIGYMAENNPLPDDMRVVEYLNFRGRLKEIPKKRLRSRVEEVLSICDLKRTARRKVIGTLSKGFRQRVGIADAILAEPEVIIMDEPTIGLDPHQILAIRDLIDSLRGKMTVIISSHILAEVEVSCDRVIIINQGRIVATGTHESLRQEFIDIETYNLCLQGELSQIDTILRGIDPQLTWAPGSEPDEYGFNTLTLETPRSVDIGEDLLNAFHQRPEIRVRSINRVEPSLEDIFLAATKRSWEERLPARRQDGRQKSDASPDGRKRRREAAPVEVE